jgi:hypothetical protein
MNSGRNDRLPVERYEQVLTLWANLPDCPSDRTGEDAEEAALRKAVAPIKAICPGLFRDPTGDELAGGDQTWILGVRFHLREAWVAPEAERQWIINSLRGVYAGLRHTNTEKAARQAQKRSNLDRLEKLYSDASEDVQAVHVLRELRWRAKAHSNIERVRVEAERWGLVIRPMPPDTTFDRMLRYFLFPDTRPLRCPNPRCRQPYFFKDRDKRTQVYCTEECSRDARRETWSGYYRRSGKAARQARKSRLGSRKNRRG